MMLAQSTPSGAVLGFYTRADLPHYHRLADEYVLFDHFFQAMSGGSTGNALYLAAARSAQWSKPPPAKTGSLDPPVFDRPYDKNGILINDVAPVNGPTEVFMGPLDLSPPPDEQTYPNIGDRLNAASLVLGLVQRGLERGQTVGVEDRLRTRRRLGRRRHAGALRVAPQPVPILPELVCQRESRPYPRQRGFSRRSERRAGCRMSRLSRRPGHMTSTRPNSAPRWGEEWVMGSAEGARRQPAWGEERRRHHL